ncbi:MAG: hypothetical protein KC800_21720 [Candidatus Eremiobacteraeota bacterium]|nr:hypothetical protein [Candidatus Eremiobacteraeota bacterium]
MRMIATIYVLAWLVGTLLLLMRVRFVPLPLDFPWFYLRNMEVGVTAAGVEFEYFRDLNNRPKWVWAPFSGWTRGVSDGGCGC